MLHMILGDGGGFDKGAERPAIGACLLQYIACSFFYFVGADTTRRWKVWRMPLYTHVKALYQATAAQQMIKCF